jgi:hypothetical protein
MDEGDLTKYGARTLAFLGRCVRARAVCHAAVAIAVLAAVLCSVSTQYGVRFVRRILEGDAFAIRITDARNKPCATNHISPFVGADSDLRAAL